MLAASTLARLQIEAKSGDVRPYRPKSLEAIHRNATRFE